jgi:metal-sulfur cluster biosynthetic enzyme
MADVKIIENQNVSQSFKQQVIDLLSSIYDPELPLNIYDLGLIYEIHFNPAQTVGKSNLQIIMTLTTPACPVAGSLPGEVADKLKTLDEVEDANTTLTWSPAWSKARLSPEHELLFSAFM